MLAVAPGWELDVERGPDWLLVKIRSLDGSSTDPPLAEGVWEQLERHFTYRVVLELDQVKVLNSHLIGQLVRLYRLIRERDGIRHEPRAGEIDATLLAPVACRNCRDLDVTTRARIERPVARLDQP